MARLSADERREAVLRAAVVEFGRLGYEAASTTSIAQAVGISQGYVFRLFPTKRALFLAAVERAFGEAEEILRGSGDQPERPTFATLRRRYEQMVSDGDLMRLQLHVYSRALDDPECQEIARRGFLRIWVAVSETTGTAASDLLDFFAQGMLLNVVTALGLPAPSGREFLAASLQAEAADTRRT